jgi:DHA2 family multidrug resistance protein
MSPQSAHALFDFTVNSQAAIMGLDDFFYISTFIFILIIPLIWITRPAKGSSDAAAGAH